MTRKAVQRYFAGDNPDTIVPITLAKTQIAEQVLTRASNWTLGIFIAAGTIAGALHAGGGVLAAVILLFFVVTFGLWAFADLLEALASKHVGKVIERELQWRPRTGEKLTDPSISPHDRFLVSSKLTEDAERVRMTLERWHYNTTVGWVPQGETSDRVHCPLVDDEAAVQDAMRALQLRAGELEQQAIEELAERQLAQQTRGEAQQRVKQLNQQAALIVG